MGQLTTHVLDTAHGRPGRGIKLQLARREANGWEPLSESITNDDGRVNGPLLSGDNFQRGEYRLTFAAGDYFRGLGVELADPPFVDEVVICFGVADAEQHYHVPLLVSPFSYSTYRGS